MQSKHAPHTSSGIGRFWNHDLRRNLAKKKRYVGRVRRGERGEGLQGRAVIRFSFYAALFKRITNNETNVKSPNNYKLRIATTETNRHFA